MQVPHDGGPCPVSDGSTVRVHYRAGGTGVVLLDHASLRVGRPWEWKDQEVLLANDIVGFEYIRPGTDPILEKIADLRRLPVKHIDLGDVLDLVEELAKRVPPVRA